MPIPIPHNLKVRIARLLCKPAVGRLVSFCYRDRVPSRGLRFDTSSALIADSIKASLFWNLYERAEVHYIRDWLRPNLDVIELGASIGVVSCHIRARLGSQQRLVAVEADPRFVSLIANNLKLNRVGQNYEIVNSAIDYDHRDSMVAFVAGAVNIVGRVGYHSSQCGSVLVPSLTLSRLVQQCEIREYALVADIEGSEAGILFQDPEALNNCQQVIIELHDTSFDGRRIGVQEMHDRFLALGFVTRARNGPVCVFERPTEF